MNELTTSPAKLLVHFVRPGVGTRDYHLSEGATLADLLRLSGASMTDQAVFIGGVAPEETLALRDGAVVTIVPRPRNAASGEPWRAPVPAFRDEAVFQEYSEALRAHRERMESGEGPKA